jgi:hypothetical protein
VSKAQPGAVNKADAVFNQVEIRVAEAETYEQKCRLSHPGVQGTQQFWRSIRTRSAAVCEFCLLRLRDLAHTRLGCREDVTTSMAQHSSHEAAEARVFPLRDAQRLAQIGSKAARTTPLDKQFGWKCGRSSFC